MFYAGTHLTVEWYYTRDGRVPAYEYYRRMPEIDQHRLKLIVKFMADSPHGTHLPLTMYRIEDRPNKIFAFKPRAERFFNFTSEGATIIITNAYRKHAQRMTRPDLEELRTAVSYRQDISGAQGRAATMKRKPRVKSQLEKDLEDPRYRKRFESDYEGLKLEIQLLLALERKHWTYSDLARAVGTQKSHISRDLKGGGLASASISRVAKMAEALGLRFVPLCVSQETMKDALPVIRRLAAA